MRGHDPGGGCLQLRTSAPLICELSERLRPGQELEVIVRVRYHRRIALPVAGRRSEIPLSESITATSPPTPHWGWLNEVLWFLLFALWWPAG